MFFSVVYFSRGTLPQKTGNRVLLGDLVMEEIKQKHQKHQKV